MDCWRLVRRTAPVIGAIFVLFLTLFIVLPGRLAAQTPVADWEFDEGSGNTALDSSGNGHDATLSNGVRWDATVDGWAVSSDGVQGSVSTPPLNLTQTHAVSVSFWAERNYTTAEGGGALFATGRSDASSTTGFALLPDNSTCHGIQIEFRGNVGTTSNCYSQPSSGVWHHLVVVMDKSRTGGDAIAFYVDGVLQNPNWNFSSATNTNNFGNDPLYLFSRDGDPQFAAGSIREFRIYDTALNAEQVAQLYADSKPQGAPTVGLVAAYAFNEGSGSKVADASGNGNTGTVANAAWSGAGKFGNALVFNGTSSLVTIPDSSSLHLKSAMTLEAWVNPSVSLCNAGEMIAKGSADYFLGGCSSGGGGPGAGATLNLSKVAAHGRAQVPANTWTHLAATYNGSAFSVYQNGKKVSTRFYRGNIAESSSPLQIGGNSILGQYFSGAIDELRIYDVALTQAQIQRDMNAPIKAVLQSISITPQSASFTVGESRQIRAIGIYSDGSQQDLTNSVTWTSSSSAIATISSSGTVSGISVGKTTLQGTIGAKLASIEVYVGPANFTIGASPSLLTIAQGSQGASTITSTTYYGFNSAVYLSARGVPTGATVSFVPNHIAAPGNGNSIMTISVGANTAVGSYPITVTAMAGAIQLRTATVTLTVTAPPDFTIGANPSSVSVVQGQQGSSTITTTVSGGFNSAINLSATGVPNGTTVSFSPNPIAAPGNGSSTMTVAVGGNTAVGTYPITVTGSGEGIQRATVVTLTVFSIALDGDVHGGQDSGSNATNTESVSIGTPSAGDLITCEVTFNSGNNNALVAVGDNNNGSYTATMPMDLDPDMQQWSGIYYIENVSNSPTIVTVQTTQSEPNLAISCQAWIGVDASDSLDEGFSQLLNEVSAPDPSTGADKMPATDGELVLAAVGLHNSGMPTAGGNYSLIDGAPYTQWWPEYWIQMTASSTAGNYNWPIDTWADSMAAFLSASSRNFTLSASPRSLSVAQGQQGNSILTTTIRRGFNSAIMFSASGVPNGTTVSFNPNPIAAPGNGSSTMTHQRGRQHGGGDLSHYGDRQRRRHPAQHHGYLDGDGGAGLHHHGESIVDERGAGQSGYVNDHDNDQRRVQQRNQPVGQRSANWCDGELQSQPDCGAGQWLVDHDDYRRCEHSGGDLSHHGDRQRWRDSADRHGHAHGHGAGQLHALRLTDVAEHCSRQPRRLHPHHHHQRRFQQRHHAVGLGSAYRDHGELQSQPDCSAGQRLVDHDDCRGCEHGGGHVSDHGDRQRWRDSANCYGHAHGHSAGELHAFRLTDFAERCSRQPRHLHPHYHHQWRL